MYNEELIKGNKLIAEYMGACYYHDKGVWRDAKSSMRDRLDHCQKDDLKFHSSWDWLMPVVEKAYDLADENTKQFKGLSIFEYGIATPIKDVWLAVVEFINWYNKTKIAALATQ